ncbi:MAG: DMT family transporter [Granulosicoccus sp.]|nr:DMT family transporter [Granulosicoccus sp.]
MKRWHANLVLLLAGATWGMGFVAQSTAMDSIGPMLFIALRFSVAALVVLPFALHESRRMSGSGSHALCATDWLKFILIGWCMFGGMATQQVGLLSTSVTNSGFLTGLYVVFTPILAVLLFREIPHRITWLAAMLSLAGIYLLAGGRLDALVIGDLLTILSAIFWALQLVLIARFVGQTGRPLALALTQFSVIAVVALVLAWLLEPIDGTSIIAAAPQILFAGVFAGGFAFTLQVIAQRYTSASQAAIFLSSEAPFAALFAFLLLDERTGWIGIAGCGLILTAMLAVELVPQWSMQRLERIRSGIKHGSIKELP